MYKLHRNLVSRIFVMPVDKTEQTCYHPCALVLLGRRMGYEFLCKLGKVKNMLQRDPSLAIELRITFGSASSRRQTSATASAAPHAIEIETVVE
jgi:hypothetical protein